MSASSCRIEPIGNTSQQALPMSEPEALHGSLTGNVPSSRPTPPSPPVQPNNVREDSAQHY